MFKKVCLGGTFDNIHAGHKLLFGQATKICQQKLVVGITDGNMIKSKLLWELIAPVDERIQRVREYLTQLNPNLIYDIVPISDLYGPTIKEEDLECIVVSKETIRGAEKINEARKLKGWNALEVQVLDVIQESDDSSNKVSSSTERIKKLGTILKPPIPNPTIPNRPYLIGLTGGIASGKTAIGKYLESLGFGYINYDLLGHRTYERIDSPIYKQIVEQFGHSVLDESTNQINQCKLGKLVFSDKNKLQKLNEIVWPEIYSLLDEEIEILNHKHDVIVLESAFLIESSQMRRVHQVWTSVVPTEEAIKRQMEGLGLSRDEAENRINAQIDNLTRVKNSNIVFCTLWEPEFTQQQLRKSVKTLREKYLAHRIDNKILKAKSKARPELIISESYNEWTVLNLAQRLDLRLEPVAKRDTLDRVDVTLVKQSEFIENYEKSLKPVVLTHVTDCWPAKDKWTFDYFMKRYRNERFKCGEDDYGYNVKMKMKHFIYYMNTHCDDSPLYIFDGNFGDHKRKRQLLNDYSLPKYFSEDLFKYAGSNRRPPYRWIVIGGARSGTGIHIDPLGTSAWNALLVGYKRWCLFPTETPRDYLKLNQIIGGKQSSEAAQWFNLVYPCTQDPSWPPEYSPIEILQRPGETVFVPSGWWHVVLNLTDTIAITQNFVSTTNFPIVWHKTVRSRPKLSKKWLLQLNSYRPDLVDVTKRIDLNRSIGITSDSSSGSSSSSSSSSSSCSSCDESESEDSGQASLTNNSHRKRKRRDSEMGRNKKDSHD